VTATHGDGLLSSVRTLTATEITAVQTAARIIPGTDTEKFRDVLRQVQVRDVVRGVWPGFDVFVEELRRILGRAPHFALVRGVPADGADLLFIAVTSSLGSLAEPYQQSWSRLVHSIEPRRDRVTPDYGVLNELLHTDGTDWQEPNDLTCLLCHRPDQHGGGRTRLLSRPGFLADAASADPRLVTMLSDIPVPWMVADALGGEIIHRPVISPSRIRWLKYAIDTAVRRGAAIDSEAAAAVQELDVILQTAPSAIEFMLERGDLLLVDNTRCLHARTPIADPQGSERALSRIKVHRQLAI
jgi:TfdA family taurine catabolism dioxygenase TauD